MTLTREKYDEYQKRLRKLREQLRDIQEADDLVRSAELSSTHPAGVDAEEKRINKAIEEIEGLLRQTEINADSEENKPQNVRIEEGAKIKIRVSYGADDIEVIDATFVVTAKDMDDISMDSPMGKAIYSKSVGEKAQFTLPVGHTTAEIEILKIEI